MLNGKCRYTDPLNTERILNVYKTFSVHPGRLLIILFVQFASCVQEEYCMSKIGQFPRDFLVNNFFKNKLISGMHGKFSGLHNMFEALHRVWKVFIFVTINSPHVYECTSFLLLSFISVLSCNLKQIVEY